MLLEETNTILPINVPAWNILGFGLLAILLDLIIAERLRNLWAKYNGLRAMKAHRVRLNSIAATRLGPSQEVDGNSVASRVIAVTITAITLAASLLVEFGSSDGRAASTRDCVVSTLHSSKHHQTLFVELRNIEYPHRGQDTYSLGGTTRMLKDVPSNTGYRARESIGNATMAPDEESLVVCPEFDYPVIRFQQQNLLDEVQIVRDRQGGIALQIWVRRKLNEDWLHIMNESFIWNSICDKNLIMDQVDMPRVSENFVRSLWKCLVKGGQGFTGLSALPYPEVDNRTRGANVTLQLQSDLFVKGFATLSSIEELFDFLSKVIGYEHGARVFVSMAKSQRTEKCEETESQDIFPTRPAINFKVDYQNESYSIDTPGAKEGTSAVVASLEAFFGVTEIFGEGYVCMLGDPWVACAARKTDKEVFMFVGQVYNMSMTQIGIWYAAVGSAKTSITSNRLRETLFNYVLLSSMKQERQLGWQPQNNLTGHTDRAIYHWERQNVVIPAKEAKAEDAICISVASRASVNGLFYLGMSLLVGLYVCLLFGGYVLRKNIPVDIERTLIRTQNELLLSGEEHDVERGNVREVGIYTPSWSEGEKHLGTVPSGVETEGASSVDEVRTRPRGDTCENEAKRKRALKHLWRKWGFYSREWNA